MCMCAVSGRHLLSAEASLFIFRGATLKDKVSGQVSSPGQPDANLSQALLHPQLIFYQLPIVLSNCWTSAIGSLTISASNYAVGPNIKRDCLSTFDSQDEIQAITLDKSARKPVGLCFRLSSDPSCISKMKPLWFPSFAIHEAWVSLKTLAFPELLWCALNALQKVRLMETVVSSDREKGLYWDKGLVTWPERGRKPHLGTRWNRCTGIQNWEARWMKSVSSVCVLPPKMHILVSSFAIFLYVHRILIVFVFLFHLF